MTQLLRDRWVTGMVWPLGGLIVLSVACILWLAPPEAVQGYAQKIFYIHVGSALAMYVGFGTAAVAALAGLARRERRFDHLLVAGVEVGLVFCSTVLLTGPIWARPVWGVWWTWDPRLTSTLLCWILFASVLAVRGAVLDAARRQLLSAAMVLFAALDIPIIIFAVKIWRGAHPSVLGQHESMPVSMRVTLVLTMATLMLWAALLVRMRYLIQVRKVIRGVPHG